MTGKKNVPNLRFKEFSDEWEEKRLGDICKINMGQSPDSEFYNIDKLGIPLIQGAGDLNGKYTNPNLYTSKYSKTCDVGDILMVVKPIGPTVKSAHFAAIGRGLCAFIYKESEFLLQLLISKRNYWSTVSQGSIMQGVSVRDIKEAKFGIPSLTEQQKIGAFLSSLDNLIEKQEEKVRLLENEKKGLMQKIFSQEIRFKDDDGNDFPKWEEKRLGECVKSKCKGTNPNYTDFGNKLLTTEALENSSINIFVSNEDDVTIKDILILWDGSQAGKVYTNRKGVLGSTFVKLTLNKLVNNIYIYQLLKLNNFRIQACWREGSGIPHVAKDFLRSFKVSIPSLEEQEKIANFLSAFDQLIEKEKQLLADQKALKQGLLQQMFV